MSRSAPVPRTGEAELRCCCHRLLARAAGGRVVLRCPRCKAEATLVVAGVTGEVDYHLVFQKSK